MFAAAAEDWIEPDSSLLPLKGAAYAELFLFLVHDGHVFGRQASAARAGQSRERGITSKIRPRLRAWLPNTCNTFCRDAHNSAAFCTLDVVPA